MENFPAFDPSIDEVERSAKRARDWIRRVTSWMGRMLRLHRRIIFAVGGLLGLLHGGTFSFTVLFLKSFAKSGWPLMKNGLERGMAAYEEAKARQQFGKGDGQAEAQKLRSELTSLTERLAEMRREGVNKKAQQDVVRQMREVRQELETLSVQATPVLIAACEPAVIRDVVLGIWSGVTVSLTAACSSAARTVGIGIGLGEVVSKMMVAVFSKAELAIRCLSSRLPPEAVMLTYLGPSIFGSTTLTLLGHAAGCWFTSRLEQLAVVLSVSLLSAYMLLDACGMTAEVESEEPDDEEKELLPLAALFSGASEIRLERREAIAWSLAVASLMNQRAHNFKIPLILEVPLLPAIGIEALLRKLSFRLTKESYS